MAARQFRGWLLSCRQAYVEGLGAVFRANRVLVSTGALVLHTPRLLRSECSAGVRDVVLRLSHASLVRHARDHLGLDPGLPAYRALVGRIPDAFPGLTRLELIVETDGQPPSSSWWWHDTDETDDRVQPAQLLLGPVDAVVAAFDGRLDECQLVVADWLYHGPLLSRDVDVDVDVAAAVRVETGLSVERYWRPLPGGPARLRPRLGYWVKTVPPGREVDLVVA